MPSIFISGIPKGLDRETASLRIRKDIETVAQVRTIWIQKEKGYGFVSLHDETSAVFVLSLNEKICINGNALRITRWRKKSRLPETPRQRTAPICTQQVNNDVFVLRGYDTYTNYRCHRPQSDVLYQYIQETPKQKKLKRKPWKDMNRVSQLSSPKSRKNVRAKRRKCRKKITHHTTIKHSTSSSEVGLHSVSKRHKRSKFNLSNVPASFTRKDSLLKNTLRSSIKTENINKKLVASIHTRTSATVHVYDHSKRLCSIEVDNNNVLESIQAELSNKENLPSYNTILISHNGKTVNNQWQPKMANDDNIHIVVKGKGGMMQGDLPDKEHNADDEMETKTYDRPRKTDDTASYTEKFVNKSVGEEQSAQPHLHQVLPVSALDQNKLTAVSRQFALANSPLREKQTSDYDRLAATLLNQIRLRTMPTPATTVPIGAFANLPLEHLQVPVEREQKQTPVQDMEKERSKAVNQTVEVRPKKDHTVAAVQEVNSSSLVSTFSQHLEAEVRPTRDQTDTIAQKSASSPLASTFSHHSEEYQAMLINELHLDDYFPDQLTFATVMSISDKEKDEADTLADLPRLILRKLIMLDFTSRENDLSICLTKMKRLRDYQSNKCQGNKSCILDEDFHSDFDYDEDSQEKSIANLDRRSPVDIFLSIFICLHPTLKQKVCLKMFACHLAIPIIFPFRKNKEQDKLLMFSMWPLRSITVNDGNTDTSIVNCKQNIVSFVRLGRPRISKSKLANELLYDTAHNAFFNYDCILGSSEKQASVGLVEASWFLPSPKQPSELQTVTVFLNLRGDASNNAEQMEYLKSVSRVMIIVADKEYIQNKKDLEYFKRANFNVLFLLTGKVSKEFLIKYKQLYMASSPDGFNAEFMQESVHGKNIGLSEIKETILNIIGPMLNGTNSTKTIQEMCEQARTMGITIDEDMPTYKNGRIAATKLFDKVEHCPLTDIKLKFTPLQGEHWQEYTKAMKSRFKSIHKCLEEKEELIQKMELQRTEQWNAYKTGEQFIKDFIEIFLKLNDDNLVCFLESLKFELDEKSRKEMPMYRTRYAAALNKFQTTSETDKAKAEKEVEEAERKLSNASFGIEHIFRELGQIYEANLIESDRKFGSSLAKAVARSLKLGFPFELMDGDVANVPLKWVEGIFDELKDALSDSKVLILSILGLQSSGKSTLLNAMFGLTFSVSAGRCTRGIYLQLFPVQKSIFKFDYVLVVDTEGLRAPELGEQKHQYDNELATLVLGMADITIINIKGENTSEVKDILQICVHAFLRLKIANQSLQLRQSCIFIHQNVLDDGAKDSMIHARKKLDETLDRMTMEAAKEENISDIKCFKDVINFDSNHHVWYFSDLWKGDPLMAPANPGYSRDVREVKSFIFGTLTQNKVSYLTISDSFVHIKDLWNGILANDFVFSFRNSLEIRTYNALDRTYQDLIWDLEIFTKDLMQKAETEMKQRVSEACGKDTGNDKGIVQSTSTIQSDYQERFCKKQLDLKTDLKKHFEESEKKDVIAKWKHRKLSELNDFTTECRHKLKRQLTDMQSHCIVDFEMIIALQKRKNEIDDKAKYLAEQLKGTRLHHGDMTNAFDDMWEKWIGQLNVQDEYSIDIKESVKNILFETFSNQKDVVDTELTNYPLGRYKSFKTLVNGMNKFEFNKTHIHVSVKFSFRNFVSHITGTPVIKEEVIRITNIILSDIDFRLQELKKKDWKFDEIKMKEILKCILQHIDLHNQDAKTEFTLLVPYKVTLAIYVFGCALPLFEQLDSEYKRKHSMKTKLNNHKKVVWCHFQDVVKEKSATVIACERFCEVIREQIKEKVHQSLPELIYQDIVIDMGKSKYTLMVRILTDLANEHQALSFIRYTADPFLYATKWLKKYIDTKCFQSPTHLYAELVSTEVKHKLKTISEAVANISSSCVCDWLSDLLDKIKDDVLIPSDLFYLVLDQKITDLGDFSKTVKERLTLLGPEIEENLKKETPESVVWYNKTPYEICTEKLWGCKAVCMFCSEPCKWHCSHSNAHSCVQHRAVGASGIAWDGTGILALESCNFFVHSCNHFVSRSKCKGPCTADSNTKHSHPYKDYKLYHPDWNIDPSPDIVSSKYWAWVLCTFNEEIAQYHNEKKAQIPLAWTRYTKDEAIQSLRL